MATPYRAVLTRDESTRGLQVSHNTTTPAADQAIGTWAQIRGGINPFQPQEGKTLPPGSVRNHQASWFVFRSGSQKQPLMLTSSLTNSSICDNTW
jgi:hypothetical protein